jgi:hypothetical protein
MMIYRALILTFFSFAANASPAEAPEADVPPVVSESPEVIAWRQKPVLDRGHSYIPAPIVKPIPADQLVKNREPHGLPFEWHAERGWIDRRK